MEQDKLPCTPPDSPDYPCDREVFERVWRRVMPEDRPDCPFVLDEAAAAQPAAEAASLPEGPAATAAAPGSCPFRPCALPCPCPRRSPAARRNTTYPVWARPRPYTAPSSSST